MGCPGQRALFLFGWLPAPPSSCSVPDHVRKNGSGPSGGRDVLSALEWTSHASGPSGHEEKVQFNARKLWTHVWRWLVVFGRSLLNRTNSSESEGAIWRPPQGHELRQETSWRTYVTYTGGNKVQIVFQGKDTMKSQSCPYYSLPPNSNQWHFFSWWFSSWFGDIFLFNFKYCISTSVSWLTWIVFPAMKDKDFSLLILFFLLFSLPTIFSYILFLTFGALYNLNTLNLYVWAHQL